MAKVYPSQAAIRQRALIEHDRKREIEKARASALAAGLSEAHRAWFAALIDGEGTICATVNKPQKRSSRPRAEWHIDIYNTNLNLLTVAQDRWPASKVRPRKLYGNTFVMSRRQSYYWYVTGVENAKAFLCAIMPHLIVKRRPAELMYQLLCYTGLPTREPAIGERRIQIAREIQSEYAKGRVK